MGLEDDISPEDQRGCSLLRSAAEGLAFVRAIDATQLDALRVGVVRDFEGVAVKDGDDGAPT